MANIISKTFGYCRVSSTNQKEDRQLEAMLELGINERDIFVDKCSGKNFDRPQYQALKVQLREITFDSLYKAYVTYAEANNFSMNTITSREGLYRNYLQFFSDKKVVDITKQVVQNWAIEAKKQMPVYSYNNTLKKAKAI